VYFSTDDGEQWQSLRLNMPATSIRDLVLHEDDIAVATHGRGFWILDDIEPLRQATANAGLLKPQRAWRFRWNKNTDTPLPADEPAGQNPPEGAILDYRLPSDAKEVTLEILDANGALVRRYSSNDPARPPQDTGNVPWYWIRPFRPLPLKAGHHRVTWDLRYPPLPQARPSFPIAAVPFDTPPSPTSPYVMPGAYTVRLTVDGKTSTQPLVVEMDPRVKATREELAQQFALSMKVYGWIQQLGDDEQNAQLRQAADTLLEALQSADAAPSTQLAAAVAALGAGIPAR
jgi:hypothetical protein